MLNIVRERDTEIRDVLPNNSFWFAPVSPEPAEFDLSVTRVGKNRKVRVSKDLRSWLKKVDLPYHAPHKFRHSHAVYALKNAKDVSTLKEVSQNLMHANLSITDDVYGILSEKDVKTQITALGIDIKSRNDKDLERRISRLEEIIQKKNK